MPRKPRMYMAGMPCHVVQRGNNRDATFYSDDDYQFYLACLEDGIKRYRVAVHAFVLMTNHVHLLMTPNDSEGVSRLMQSIGRRYVQYVNKTYQRTGTLWESRHKASLVQEEQYLLKCYRYIELNPVRAGIVVHPADYRWSSFRGNANGHKMNVLSPHPAYIALGSSDEYRQTAYRELFRYHLDNIDIHEIRNAATFSMPLGDSRFREQVEQALGRSIGQALRGRPVRRKAE